MGTRLTEREERFVRRVKSRYVFSIIYGIVLIASGGAYGSWAVAQLSPSVAPDPAQAFDRPIARLATIFGRKRVQVRDGAHPESPRERQMLQSLSDQADLLARWVLLTLRLLLFSMLMTIGGASLVFGLTCKHWLPIIGKLQQNQEVGGDAPLVEPPR